MQKGRRDGRSGGKEEKLFFRVLLETFFFFFGGGIGILRGMASGSTQDGVGFRCESWTPKTPNVVSRKYFPVEYYENVLSHEIRKLIRTFVKGPLRVFFFVIYIYIYTSF